MMDYSKHELSTKKHVELPKKNCDIISLSPHKGRLSTTATFFCSQVVGPVQLLPKMAVCGEVRLYTEFVFIPMTMTPLLTFCDFVGGWEDQSEHESVCHKWSTWCPQKSMRCCMTERDLRIKRFPFARFLSAGSAPSLMRLRQFDLPWLNSSQFKDQRSNHERISCQVRIIWTEFQ